MSIPAKGSEFCSTKRLTTIIVTKFSEKYYWRCNLIIMTTLGTFVCLFSLVVHLMPQFMLGFCNPKYLEIVIELNRCLSGCILNNVSKNIWSYSDVILGSMIYVTRSDIQRAIFEGWPQFKLTVAFGIDHPLSISYWLRKLVPFRGVLTAKKFIQWIMLWVAPKEFEPKATILLNYFYRLVYRIVQCCSVSPTFSCGLLLRHKINR